MTDSKKDDVFRDSIGRWYDVRQQPLDGLWYVIRYTFKDGKQDNVFTDFGYFASREEALEAAARAAKAATPA